MAWAFDITAGLDEQVLISQIFLIAGSGNSRRYLCVYERREYETPTVQSPIYSTKCGNTGIVRSRGAKSRGKASGV